MSGYFYNQRQYVTFQDCKNMGLCLVDLIQAVVEMNEYRARRGELLAMAKASRDEEALDLIEEYDEYFKRQGR